MAGYLKLPIRHKYNAVRCESDGIKFHSKKERLYYSQLKIRKQAGEVIFFLRQTPFHFRNGTKYVVDFIEFWADGSVHFIDVKGARTQSYKNHLKSLKVEYPEVEIEEK